MTSPITLAHITDVHLAPIEGFTLPYWNVKRGLGLLNWRRGRILVHQRRIADLIAADIRAQAPDHIAVTGDLANLGLPAEYRAAKTWLEALGHPGQVSVVPGNHDIYTGRLYGASCLKEWAAYMTGDARSELEGGFPYVRRLGPIALIGLNSARPTPPFVAAGLLGTQQLADLGSVLEQLRVEGLARVVLIHHPPLPGQAPRMRALDDAAALQATLAKNGAELALHGHNHTQTTVWLAAAHGPIPVCGMASASAAMAHGEEPLARYALYRIEGAGQAGKSITIDRVVRGLVHEESGITELSRMRMQPNF